MLDMRNSFLLFLLGIISCSFATLEDALSEYPGYCPDISAVKTLQPPPPPRGIYYVVTSSTNLEYKCLYYNNFPLNATAIRAYGKGIFNNGTFFELTLQYGPVITFRGLVMDIYSGYFYRDVQYVLYFSEDNSVYVMFSCRDSGKGQMEEIVKVYSKTKDSQMVLTSSVLAQHNLRHIQLRDVRCPEDFYSKEKLSTWSLEKSNPIEL